MDGIPDMKPLAAMLLAGAVLLPGCKHPPARDDVTYSQYHAARFDWGAVNRVLLLPLVNETAYPRATEEVRQALAAELQQLGRFEVVPAPPDVQARLSHQVRDRGAFNEAVLIQLARQYRVEAVVLGTLTQYSPYAPPRLGLSLQVVSPGDAVVVASIDGLWDTTQTPVVNRVRAFYHQRPHVRDPSAAADLALESPYLFDRFVCFEAANVLVSGYAPELPGGEPGERGAPAP